MAKMEGMSGVLDRVKVSMTVIMVNMGSKSRTGFNRRAHGVVFRTMGANLGIRSWG